jgi:predicted metal-dependent HD superfamily phosphohydrolase
MSNFDILPPQEGLSKKQSAAELLTMIGHGIVDSKYGPQSTRHLIYHGPEHTAEVTDSARQLGERAYQAGKISAGDIDLLKIAAAFHDTVFEYLASDNEAQSAELAVTAMRTFNCFSEEDYQQVREAIAATVVKDIIDDRIIQSADGKGYLAQLMADADLSSLGSQPGVYWTTAQRFFKETNPDPKAKLVGDVLKSFIERQKRVVSAHQFYTDEAQELFHYKPDILSFLDTLGRISGPV